MWHCSNRERTLRITERKLMKAAVVKMVEEIYKKKYKRLHDDESMFGMMSNDERLITLAYCCSYLENGLDAPKVEPWMETTICAIFDCVKDYVDIEIKMLSGTKAPKEFRWRLLILSALSEAENNGAIEENFENNDFEVWHAMLDLLKEELIYSNFNIYEKFCYMTDSYAGPLSNAQLVKLAKTYLETISK